MANKTLSGTRIQLRRDTAENWSAKNPVLLAGEAGYDTSNYLLKIGDGISTWNGLLGIQYLPLAGGAVGSLEIVGQLTTRDIVPALANRCSIGTASLPYKAIYARTLSYAGVIATMPVRSGTLVTAGDMDYLFTGVDLCFEGQLPGNGQYLMYGEPINRGNSVHNVFLFLIVTVGEMSFSQWLLITTTNTVTAIISPTGDLLFYIRHYLESTSPIPVVLIDRIANVSSTTNIRAEIVVEWSL